MHLTRFESQFMKRISNTEAKLKKSFDCKEKSVIGEA